MASLRQVLVSVAICMAAADKTCNTETAGQCNFIGCYASRGPVDCLGSFPSKKCVCQPGYCTNDDKSTCIPEGGPGGDHHFNVGDAVEVKDQSSDVATSGTVTKTKPLEVQPDGCKSGAGSPRSFTWGIVNHEPPMYKVGDAVMSRDSYDDDWKSGTVTKVSKDGVEVQPTGWTTSFTFQQVRPLHWQKIYADQAAANKKRLAQFATALKGARADAAAAKRASDDAISGENEAADTAAAAQKASVAAAAKLNDAEADEAQKKSKQVATDKSAQMASAKTATAHQATVTAKAAQTAAEDKAAKEASTSEAAQQAAAKKKAQVTAQQVQETQEAGVAENSLKQAKDEEAKGNKAMASAMYAAYDQARNALNATRSLVLELQGQQAGLDSRAAQAASASSDAQKDAAIKKEATNADMQTEAQEARNSGKAAHIAATAKEAADAASANRKQAAEAAAAAKKASDAAAAKHKAATTGARKQVAAYKDAAAASSSAWGKQQCAASKHVTSQIVLFQKAAPKNNDNSPMLIVTGLFAAVAMIMTFAWRSTRLGGSVVMPESLLG